MKYTALTLGSLMSLFAGNYGQTCTSYTTEVDCDADDSCVWSASDAMCGCASTSPQDIMFIMDRSGSVGSTGWETEVTFVSDLIETGVGPDSKISVLTFATDVLVEHTFTDDQDRTSLIAEVDALPFSAGWTHTLDALTTAIDVFDTTGDLLFNDLAFLITDGQPFAASGTCADGTLSCQNVCDDSTMKDALDAAGITVVIVAVGTFNQATIECLVDDTATQIIQVADFDDDAFEAVRALTDSFLCPDLGTTTTTTAAPSEEPTAEPRSVP